MATRRHDRSISKLPAPKLRTPQEHVEYERRQYDVLTEHDRAIVALQAVTVGTGGAAGSAGATGATGATGSTVSPTPYLFSWIDNATVGLDPILGDTLRVYMNDGTTYTSDATLYVTTSVQGLGGLDSGTEAASTWYYVYAVPNTGSEFALVISRNTPSSGPLGLLVENRYKYMGAIRNDGSSNIVKFRHSGLDFYFERRIADVDYTTTDKSTISDVTLAYIPLTASFAHLQFELRHTIATPTNTRTAGFYVSGDDGTGNPFILFTVNYLEASTAGGAFTIPTPGTASKVVGYKTNAAGQIENQAIYTSGWRDGYL